MSNSGSNITDITKGAAAPMLDVDQIVAEAQADVTKELADAAKKRVVGSLRAIASAKTVLANLEREHAAILRDIGAA